MFISRDISIKHESSMYCLQYRIIVIHCKKSIQIAIQLSAGKRFFNPDTAVFMFNRDLSKIILASSAQSTVSFTQ
jgi:hypothetical protein